MFINGEVKKWKKNPTKYCSRSRLFLGSQKPMQNEYSYAKSVGLDSDRVGGNIRLT